MGKMLCTALAATMLLTGCASMGRGSAYVPLVDMQGHEPAAFQQDVQQCQEYANTRMNAETGALIGAVAVALLGAFLAPRGFRNEVAGRAAVIGGFSGAAEAGQTQESITKRCLAGRGYNVLN